MAAGRRTCLVPAAWWRIRHKVVERKRAVYRIKESCREKSQRRYRAPDADLSSHRLRAHRALGTRPPRSDRLTDAERPGDPPWGGFVSSRSNAEWPRGAGGPMAAVEFRRAWRGTFCRTAPTATARSPISVQDGRSAGRAGLRWPGIQSAMNSIQCDSQNRGFWKGLFRKDHQPEAMVFVNAFSPKTPHLDGLFTRLFFRGPPWTRGFQKSSQQIHPAG
jgi:hypothetical protein